MDDVKTAIPSVNETAVEAAAQLLSAFDSASRATVIASAVASLIPDSACIVHLYQLQNDPASWMIAGFAGESKLLLDVFGLTEKRGVRFGIYFDAFVR